jgi:GNAT superfamily N-acetyltransferase
VTTIRRATVDDAPALAALRWAWHHENGSESTETYEDFAAHYCTWWAGAQDSHYAVVADASGELVGMGFLALLTRVPDVDHPRRIDGDIQSVYVEPILRGTGVGTDIVRELIKVANDVGCEKVTVQSSTRARSLYGREGFEVPSRVMVRPLA